MNMETSKIKIKLNRETYDALNGIVEYVASTFPVYDVYSLYAREELEKISAKFATKKWKHLKSYSFSLTISEVAVFTKFIGEAMTTLGSYERAIYNLIISNEITPQVQQAVQMRMNFNNN
jgi:stringent starvation protein B